MKIEKYENLMHKYLFCSNDLKCGHKGYREAQLIRHRRQKEGEVLQLVLTDGFRTIKYNYYSNIFRAMKAFRALCLRINKGYQNE